MRPETRKLVDEIEKRSGYPVHIVPVKDLSVVAKASLSPLATDSYVVQYRPGISFVDFAIAVQCSQILRLLVLPESDRLQFGATAEAIRWGLGLLKAHRARVTRSPALPEQVLETFASSLVSGLLTQLRSIPIEMRIHAALAADCPTLAQQQVEAIALEQKEALGSLDPGIRGSIPEEVVAGSILLNTAHSLFCDRLLGTLIYRVPYVAAGFEEFGNRLLAIFDELPDDPSADRALVDRWAAEIGLDDKYRWVPLGTPAQSVS